MGRGRGKGKKLTDDPGSDEEEKIPPQKRRGRPLKDDIDEEAVEMIEEDDSESEKLGIQNLEINGKKRRRNTRVKEKHDSVKEENGNDESNNVFRHRRKNKPRRAAEAGVKCN
ncbi:uncharacterized protein LOC107025732 [Solanum pennellii]|uniref:Uncharacterized protein LOC107025732 n=1 Tax=Solanum pennellii TaxID=28526 RepID=A0ABM1VF13_SOLPN|nr:uncharacterized protein LOC107025732 [Solanum pennellii]